MTRYPDLSPEEQLLVADHEIGNVSTVLAGLAHALERRWDRMTEAEKLDLVRRIAREADHLTLVTRTLRALRLGDDAGDTGAGEIVERNDPSNALRAIVNTLEPASGNHPFEVDVTDRLPGARFDVLRLEQVLLNLVTNADKFAPRGSPIKVRVHDSDGRVRIDVEDSGPGVPAELRERIFEKFVRGERAASGMGLGLFISRALMESMGGRIWVEDATGNGARFSVLLPRP